MEQLFVEVHKMHKPCPLCNKKKEHYHKDCNETGETRVLITPQKKKNGN